MLRSGCLAFVVLRGWKSQRYDAGLAANVQRGSDRRHHEGSTAGHAVPAHAKAHPPRHQGREHSGDEGWRVQARSVLSAQQELEVDAAALSHNSHVASSTADFGISTTMDRVLGNNHTVIGTVGSERAEHVSLRAEIPLMRSSLNMASRHALLLRLSLVAALDGSGGASR